MFHTAANRREEIQNLSSAADTWPSGCYSTLSNPPPSSPTVQQQKIKRCWNPGPAPRRLLLLPAGLPHSAFSPCVSLQPSFHSSSWPIFHQGHEVRREGAENKRKKGKKDRQLGGKRKPERWGERKEGERVRKRRRWRGFCVYLYRIKTFNTWTKEGFIQELNVYLMAWKMFERSHISLFIWLWLHSGILCKRDMCVSLCTFAAYRVLIGSGKDQAFPVSLFWRLNLLSAR